MTGFLRNALGFLMQFSPCAIMVFLPFSREAYRFRRGRILAGAALGSVILAALFPVVIQIQVSAGGHTAFAVNLFVFSAIFLTIAAYVWVVREPLPQKILVFFVVRFYAALQYCLVNALNGFLMGFLHLSKEYEEHAVYSLCGLILYAVTDVFLLPLMLMFVTRTLREYIREVEPHNMRQEFFIVIVFTMIFIATMICVDFTYYYLEYRLYLLILALFFALVLYQALIYWLIFRESVRRKRDDEQRRTLEIQQLQYEKIVRDMENTRRMRHDMRHHYNTLNDMLGRGRTDEIRDYLSHLIDTTVKRDCEVYCKNMTVNGLLQYYIGLARDADIRCEVHAECGEIAIEPVDLTVLFGNAMENAVNACAKCPENRWISIMVGTVQGTLAIEISNSCDAVCFSRHVQTEGEFVPAEAFLSERPGGGHGLRSIAHTARKYGGSAKFRFDADKKTFTARIRLNMCLSGKPSRNIYGGNEQERREC